MCVYIEQENGEPNKNETTNNKLFIDVFKRFVELEHFSDFLIEHIPARHISQQQQQEKKKNEKSARAQTTAHTDSI